MRTYFDKQLQTLNDEMKAMGALCEDAIALAAKALSENSRELAAKVPPISSALDQKERDVEDICLKLLLRQQPVAGDLRQISAALKMITDMERIGDQAEDIAEIVVSMSGCRQEEIELLNSMARSAIRMVTDSVDAYVSRDSAAARAVARRDDEADEVFAAIKRAMIARLSQHPGDGEYALDLMMIAKYLERIGDHATNIAEWVEFAATGYYKGREVL